MCQIGLETNYSFGYLHTNQNGDLTHTIHYMRSYLSALQYIYVCETKSDEDPEIVTPRKPTNELIKSAFQKGEIKSKRMHSLEKR